MVRLSDEVPPSPPFPTSRLPPPTSPMLPFSVDSSATAMRHNYQPLGHHHVPSVWTKTGLYAAIRPRFTVGWIFGSAIVAYVGYCFITWQPFFAHRLPQPTGSYEVGAIDIEVPLARPRLIHEAKFKGGNGGSKGENAFELETVLFTLYYPAEQHSRSSKSNHYWIPKPIAATAEGYAKVAHISNFITNTLFTGAIGLLVGSISIPAKVDVPLVAGIRPPVELANVDSSDNGSNSRSNDEEETGKGLQVIIFTHGMASSRTDYTHWASEMASRGYVVAAIEHRDGSCPGSVIMKNGQPSKTRFYFGLDDITPESASEFGGMSTDRWKDIQLSFREAEIEETVRVLQRINSGDGQEIFESNARREGVHLVAWKDRLNTVAMILAGHSYGATGTLRALRHNDDALGKQSKLPFKAAIALDPGKSSGPLNSDISVPLLVIHSNSWSASKSIFYGRPHFATVSDIVSDNNARGNPSWFMTSLGTSHPSVTDAPLIEPLLLSWTTGAHIDVTEGLRQYVHVAEDFMVFLATGRKQGLLKEKAEFPTYDENFGWGKYKGQGDGDDYRKYWQVHVAPE